MEMEEERIGMVLVRASELRSKLTSFIHSSSTSTTAINPLQQHPQSNNININGDSTTHNLADDNITDTETLLYISDAFDSLESLLASFQALQLQQQYQREALIGDIEYSRKTLLKKLGEYNGEHTDVIQELEAFASMKVEHDSELLLPPYPTHSSHSLVLDKNYLSPVPYSRKLTPNGLDGESRSKNSKTQNKPNKLWGGLKFLVQSSAKTMLTLVGIVTLLKFAGFEPKLQKKGTSVNILTLFQQSDDKDEELLARCPPGKVAVMENGGVRYIVKERVEIPFDSATNNPDVSYGCG